MADYTEIAKNLKAISDDVISNIYRVGLELVVKTLESVLK